MEFKTIIDKVESSNEFKTWKQDHQEAFLAHIFVMSEDPTQEGFQVGYYNSNSDKITSFLVHGDKIEQLPPSDILKDSKHKIQPLDMEQVKFTKEEVLAVANGCRELNYKEHPIMKAFFILQTIENTPTCNLTYFTHSFKTINIKIDATSGKITKHSLADLASFDKP